MHRTSRLRARAAALALLAVLPLLASARADVREISGRVITADGGPVGAFRVHLRQGAHTASADVGPDGTFVLPAGRGGPVEVVVEPADPADRRYHRAAAALRRSEIPDGVIRAVLVPRSWTVRRGRHAGTEVEISVERAFEPACPGCSSFYRSALRDPSSGRLAPIPTWPAGVFPLRVAFTGEMPYQRIPPRDSAAFWKIVEALEEDLGADLLRPAGYRETLPDASGAPEDVILVESDPTLRRVGWGSTISQMGDIIYAAVRVRDPRVFSEREGPRLVKHELMHALGVGHTCGWRSVMAQIPQCTSRSSSDLTPEDVAYFEVLSRVGELQRVLSAQLGLDAARTGT